MKKIITRFLIGLLPVFGGVAVAATFNLFSPATGILKGSASTYVTTAAASSDVRALWTGTCNSTTFLQGDGVCAGALKQTTSVTSDINLATTTDFFVTGGTSLELGSSGSLDLDADAAIIATGLQDVLALTGGEGSIDLSSSALTIDHQTLIRSQSPSFTFADNGGAPTAAFTINGKNVCLADGTNCPGGGTTFANPTAAIGLTAVNGVATTAMRSDAAPALSQSISPTWTGTHTFTHAATAISVTNDITAGTFTGSGANLTSLAAGNVSSGTLAVARGGTNLTAAADDNVMVGNGTTWQTKAVPACTDTGGNHLNYDTSTNAFSCGTSGASSKIVYCSYTGSTGAITFSGGGGCTSGFHTGTGDNTITFSVTFATGPICTTSTVSPSLGLGTAENLTTATTIRVLTFNASTFGAQNVDTQFICIGT